ncbi:hypothetical protein [Hydrogenivirga sp.]
MVRLLLLLALLTSSCAKYVWYNPNKSPEEVRLDFARCKLEAKRYALGIPPPNNTVVNVNVPSGHYQSDGVIYLNSAQSYAYGNPYIQSYTAYGVMVGIREAEYMRACMEALGYIRVKKSELKNTTPRP